MKAITICQPYAELIARGEKRVENRSWSTKYRGELAIHAGKSRKWLDYALKPDTLVFGAVIAVVRVVDCVRFDEAPAWVKHHPFATGPFCWILEDVRRVEPAYCSGKQGLWEWNGKMEVRNSKFEESPREEAQRLYGTPPEHRELHSETCPCRRGMSPGNCVCEGFGKVEALKRGWAITPSAKFEV